MNGRIRYGAKYIDLFSIEVGEDKFDPLINKRISKIKFAITSREDIRKLLKLFSKKTLDLTIGDHVFHLTGCKVYSLDTLDNIDFVLTLGYDFTSRVTPSDLYEYIE